MWRMCANTYILFPSESRLLKGWVARLEIIYGHHLTIQLSSVHFHILIFDRWSSSVISDYILYCWVCINSTWPQIDLNYNESCEGLDDGGGDDDDDDY